MVVAFDMVSFVLGTAMMFSRACKLLIKTRGAPNGIIETIEANVCTVSVSEVLSVFFCDVCGF